MKLLVTNTQSGQAYVIIRALRPYAEKIIATMYGKHRFAARTTLAANSRFVDRRYYVPNPELDWLAGIIQKENTPKEEAYIQRVLDICEKEEVDTIFPSLDPQVYIFSKNKQRLEEKGILVPVPDYETLLTPLDKYKTIQAAQKVGFPCPRTYFPENEADLKRIAQELDPPWVIKQRQAFGGRGMAIVTNFAQLQVKARPIREHYMPMIQEYIPGRQRQVFYLMVNRGGDIVAFLCPEIVRRSQRLFRDFTRASESAVSHPFFPLVQRLVHHLGWWGTLTIQTKVDPRDNIPKLLEINPRCGIKLWNRTELGLNEPLMCLKIARGEQVERFESYPVGTLLLEPLDDLLGLGFELLDLSLYWFRTTVRGVKPIDPLNRPLTLAELIGSYRREYLGGREKVFNPLFKYLFNDPLPSLLYCYSFMGSSLRSIKNLGR